MKGIFLRIPDDLDRRFTVYCEREGYKKSGLILKWMQDQITRHEPKDSLADASFFGVDVKKLKENLRKTPTQRLRDHARASAFAFKLKQAKLKNHDPF